MRLVLGLALVLGANSFALESTPPGCAFDQECTLEVAGTYCADGTPSYYTITPRRGARNLLIYMSGGGACWDRKTCQAGFAKPLTRVPAANDWNAGQGIQDPKDTTHPFNENFDVVTVPYCTGDVFAGTKTQEYGTKRSRMTIRHVGYSNVERFFGSMKSWFEHPEKVVLLGCSAGGIGAYYHMRTLQTAFPESRKYVVSDAGTPFKHPHVPQSKEQEILDHWGAGATLPPGLAGHATTNLADVIYYNTHVYPDIRFGFLSSYRDPVMTFFAAIAGAGDPMTAVKKTIIDVANDSIGRDVPNQKVFYVESSVHCQTGKPFKQASSMGVSLGTWLSDLVDDSASFANLRPDLVRQVQDASGLQIGPRQN